MQAIRERNRTLQVDIKIMAAQVDMVTNGQCEYIITIIIQLFFRPQ